MTVRVFTFNPFATNMFVCHDDERAVLFDASCHTDGELRAVTDYIDSESLTVEALLLTHAHIDHIFGCTRLARRYGLPWRLHRSDEPLLANAVRQAEMFGVPMEAPDFEREWLAQGDDLALAGGTWHVLHTPGHSPGSISFSNAADGFAIVGDVLFNGSIGRTDLWGGSLPELMESIFQQVIPLGDETVVYCGHGPKTTVGKERQTNPFLTSPVE